MRNLFSKLWVTCLGLAFYAWLAVGSSKCGDDDGERKYAEKAKDRIEFVGRVTDSGGRPRNDRLVLVFKNGEEVGRSTSALGKYDKIEKVPNDGLFKIAFDNEYEITEVELKDIFYSFGSTSRTGSGSIYNRTWIYFGQILEGRQKELKVTSRNNVTYTIKVIAGNFNSLPEDLRNDENSTMMDKDGSVVVVGPDGAPHLEPESVDFTGKIEEIKLRDILFPVDNCGGNSLISNSYSDVQSFVHETSFDIGFDAKAKYPSLSLAGINLTTQLKSRFGFSHREVSETIINTQFAAAPGSNVMHKLVWYEVWEHGTAVVRTDGGLVSLPFKVKTRLVYKLEAVKEKCK